MATDPTLLPTEAELAATAKDAAALIAPMVEKASSALTVFERTVRDEVVARFGVGVSDEEIGAARTKTNEARERLLEHLTHPILVSRDGREDDRQEIAYLRETCGRQQKELSSLRASTSSLSGQRNDLEASNRILRLEAEDLAKILAKAQDPDFDVKDDRAYAWPFFEENSMLRFYGSTPNETDLPIVAGDSVLVVAKAMAVRLKFLRARPR